MQHPPRIRDAGPDAVWTTAAVPITGRVMAADAVTVAGRKIKSSPLAARSGHGHHGYVHLAHLTVMRAQCLSHHAAGRIGAASVVLICPNMH